MRLQLILIFSIQLLGISLNGQSLDTQSSEVSRGTKVENYTIGSAVDVNFMFGYYDQDGNHSAVTGGIGTESLTDRDLRFIINIPLDSVQQLNVNGAVNYYSSASTDNIDTKVSSASSADVRSQFQFIYTRLNPKRRSSYSLGWGGSVESDYISTSFNASWNQISLNGNSQLNIGGQVFFDNWVLIIPEELRNPGTKLPDTDRRRSYSLSVNYLQVLNKRMQLNLAGELVYQRGLLSTPFHRVYFREQDTAKIELLPENRFKTPISVRLNYFLTDHLVLRTFARYYRDNFGIDAVSASIETRIKPGTFFTLYPFYRYHFQTSAAYFAPYKQHSLTDEYYTSDYDLSRFESHSFGAGFHWSPLYGIGRFRFFNKKKPVIFNSIDVRYTHYRRNDGLRANQLGFDFGFSRLK
ncbi:MAG: hypothetical protein DHS20C17_07930 [Cyclobacteriaceae bacterium]|nr:MAG: hypothetical protein DHS20C17_07930 [Cyclobacteriaceae bacterium]